MRACTCMHNAGVRYVQQYIRIIHTRNILRTRIYMYPCVSSSSPRGNGKFCFLFCSEFRAVSSLLKQFYLLFLRRFSRLKHVLFFVFCAVFFLSFIVLYIQPLWERTPCIVTILIVIPSQLIPRSRRLMVNQLIRSQYLAN